VRWQAPRSRARSHSAPAGACCLDRHCRWCIGLAVAFSARSVLSHAGSSLLSVSALQVASTDCTALLQSFAPRPVADASTSGVWAGGSCFSQIGQGAGLFCRRAAVG
jgi:hypothetical protein